MMRSIFCGRLLLVACALSVAGAAASCGIDRQRAPAFSGPSELAISLTLRAKPDTIVQDGVSQSEIEVLARGPDANPMPGLTLQFSGTSSDPLIRSVSFTQTTADTDANGVAKTMLIAPPAPATVPATPPVIIVTATPRGEDFANAVERPVIVRLLAPPGTPLMNLDPVAVIVADPRVANFNETIRFDASLTTDEGQACGTRCNYIWEFGDNTVAVRSITAEHVFTLPGTYVVTLTVTDDRGGVDTATVDIRIIGPTPPVADFTVTPTTGPAATPRTFNAATSTVGSGATITQYAWNFGDGSPTVTTSSATTAHTYGAPGTYVVTLTVTDSLGRTNVKTSTVTVS
ncbi:MAG: PKD domain-containing protein [Vicinamibacterales bacterium]